MHHRRMRCTALVLALVFGCANRESTLAHSVEIVALTDLSWHPEKFDYLGDGCFAVDGQRAYECDTDHEPLGNVSCIEARPGWSASTYYITSWSPTVHGERRPSQRCWDKLEAKYAPGGPLPPCDLQIRDVEAGLQFELTTSDPSFLDVSRSGKIRLVAILDQCDPRAIVAKSTGFPKVDAWLLETVHATTSCKHTVLVTVKSSSGCFHRVRSL